MYNGIGLRTVRGSGTNGYVQRNLSYINALRTRQTLAHNQRHGSSGGSNAHGSGKTQVAPNHDILQHEQKRNVELKLIELSLDMEERGCDPEEIQDKVKRERERLLTRLQGGREARQDKVMNMESSHARERRKEGENQRIKDAFGITSDYMAGESFDPVIQERRRLERMEKRKQAEKEKEAARQMRHKEKEERDAKSVEVKRDALYSTSRSRSPFNRRSRDRDIVKLRKSHSRYPVKKRCSRRSSAERKRRSMSSTRSASSSRSRSRSRALQNDTRHGKKPKRSRSPIARSFDSKLGSDSDCSPKQYCKEEHARSGDLQGTHKVLDLSKHAVSVCAVIKDESCVNLELNQEKKVIVSPKRKKGTKESSPIAVKQEVKHQESLKQGMNDAQLSIPAALPERAEKEEKAKVSHSPRHSPSAVADPRPLSRKRKQRSMSPNERRRRGRSSSSVSSRSSRSSRHRRLHSRSARSDRSRSYSSDSSRSRSWSKPRFRPRRMPGRRRHSPSRSRGRDHRCNFRSRRY